MEFRRIIVGLTASAVLLLVTLTALFSHGFWARLAVDFWPPDSSPVGPNLLASVVQWLIVASVATLVYPPFRKWIERELDHVHHKMDHMIETNKNVKNLPNEEKGRPWSKNKGETE